MTTVATPERKTLGDSLPPKAVGIWLLVVCACILLMVMIGGATRLSESGLSIVDWHPVTGIVPPMSHAAWQAEFDKYKETPQFSAMWPDMTLAGFQKIFWWEFIHRLWGRIIGLVFVVPLVVFAVRRCLPGNWPLKLVLAFVLGGAQGVLGWFMVRSGLVDQPWVSPFRLTAHLMLALALFSYLLWLALDILRPSEKHGFRLYGGAAGVVLTVLLAVQLAYGGLMAGLRAALAYPTFPKFNGEWWPSPAFSLEPFWSNFVQNPALVQVIHRGLGVFLFLVLPWWAGRMLRLARGDKWWSLASIGVMALMTWQVLLGVGTLMMSRGGIPVFMGVWHQGNAVLVLACTLVLLHGPSRGRAGMRSQGFDHS